MLFKINQIVFLSCCKSPNDFLRPSEQPDPSSSHDLQDPPCNSPLLPLWHNFLLLSPDPHSSICHVYGTCQVPSFPGHVYSLFPPWKASPSHACMTCTSVRLGLCSTALPQRGILRAPPTSSVSPKPSFHVFLPHTAAWDYIKLFLIIYSLSPQLEYKLRKGSIPILSIFKCSQDVSNAQSSLRTISLKGSREFNPALSSYSHHDLFTGKKNQRSLASGGLLS